MEQVAAPRLAGGPTSSTDPPRRTVEELALSYLLQANGNPSLALRRAIGDALADLLEMERRTRRAERLISRGFVRSQPPA